MDGLDLADSASVRRYLQSAIGFLTVMEIRYPGGHARRGVLGLTTTRGDRLFITLLGTAYIFLAWLGLMGTRFGGRWRSASAGACSVSGKSDETGD